VIERVPFWGGDNPFLSEALWNPPYLSTIFCRC
jgi:hypothetical protein